MPVSCVAHDARRSRAGAHAAGFHRPPTPPSTVVSTAVAPVPPPAPVAPPSNLEPPQPLLDAGDWITLTVGIAAAVLALFTLFATRRSASAAELSANAAVDAADASKRSAKASEDMAEEA
jgi:hypothetical protein